VLTLMVLMAASPATAKELWCMPDEACVNDICQAMTDTESSVRLADLNAASTVMRSAGEDVAMERSEGGGKVAWNGVYEVGISVTLTLTPSDLAYRMVSSGEFGQTVSTGFCEVQ